MSNIEAGVEFFSELTKVVRGTREGSEAVAISADALKGFEGIAAAPKLFDELGASAKALQEARRVKDVVKEAEELQKLSKNARELEKATANNAELSAQSKQFAELANVSENMAEVKRLAAQEAEMAKAAREAEEANNARKAEKAAQDAEKARKTQAEAKEASASRENPAKTRTAERPAPGYSNGGYFANTGPLGAIRRTFNRVMWGGLAVTGATVATAGTAGAYEVYEHGSEWAKEGLDKLKAVPGLGLLISTFNGNATTPPQADDIQIDDPANPGQKIWVHAQHNGDDPAKILKDKDQNPVIDPKTKKPFINDGSVNEGFDFMNWFTKEFHDHPDMLAAGALVFGLLGNKMSGDGMIGQIFGFVTGAVALVSAGYLAYQGIKAAGTYLSNEQKPQHTVQPA